MDRILQVCLGRNMTSVINVYWLVNRFTRIYLPLMFFQRLSEICYGIALSNTKSLYVGEAIGLLKKLRIPFKRKRAYTPLLLKPTNPIDIILSPLYFYKSRKKDFSIHVTVTEDDIRASRIPFIVSKPFGQCF